MASTHTETKKQAFLKALNPLKEPWGEKNERNFGYDELRIETPFENEVGQRV